MIDFKKYIKESADNKEDKDDKAHAPYSPSAMARTMGCPASVRACAKAPKQPIGPASKKGTNAHTLLEYFFREGKVGIQALKLKEAMPFKAHIEYHSEQHQAVRFAYEYVRRRYVELYKKYNTKPILMVEKKVHIAKDCSGTSDIILYMPKKELDIMDYKNGSGPVGAAFNEQMQTYGVGFAKEVGWKFQKVSLHIIQPNTSKKSDVWVTQPKTLMEFEERILKAIDASQQKNAPYVPDAKYCFFCAAKDQCPAQQGLKSDKAASRFKR